MTAGWILSGTSIRALPLWYGMAAICLLAFAGVDFMVATEPITEAKALSTFGETRDWESRLAKTLT